MSSSEYSGPFGPIANAILSAMNRQHNQEKSDTDEAPSTIDQEQETPQEIETGEPLNAVHSVTDDTETSRTPGRRSAARAAKTKAATPSNTKAEGSRRTKKRRISREPEEESDESGSEWEVEKIVDSQIDADTHEHFYEVKWKGYPSEDNTWELKKDLVHCREAIADYEKQKKKRK